MSTRAMAFAAWWLCATCAHAQLAALEEQAFQRAAAQADPSIVRIETVGGLDVVGNVLTGTGPTTGVVVSADGEIITSSFNFLSRPSSVLVSLSDGRRFPAEIVAGDTSRKLTLLRIAATGLSPIDVLPQSDVRVGEWAIALGRTYDPAFPSISVGIISAVNRISGKAVQTDAKVSPVNYGGPLVDIEGRGIGVLVPMSPQGTDETAGVEWYDGGIGFAVPFEDVMALLPRLRKGENLKPGLMGLTFADIGPLAGEAKVDRVRPGSPADNAGLLMGDIITAADGRAIARIADLQTALADKYAGDALTLAYRRGDEKREATLTLAAELKPYESAYLGVLPVRPPVEEGATVEPGVAIREVLRGSPAEQAQLARGDVITSFDGAAVASNADLLLAVSRKSPGDELTLSVQREGTAREVTATLAELPNEIPEELSVAEIPPPPEPVTDRKTGRFTDTLPGGEQEYWAYVPEQYNSAHPYALLLWLHPAGDTQEAAIMRVWRSACDRRGIILAALKAPPSGWSPAHAEALRGLVEVLRGQYTIDPARIVVHGAVDGGGLAWHAAFKDRDMFRGVIAAFAPLVQPPPDNDPDFRQQCLLITRKSDRQAKRVVDSAEFLRRQKFPTELLEVSGTGTEYPDEAAMEPVFRWLDALDRI